MKFRLKEILNQRHETMKHVSDETGISQNTLSLLNQGKSGGIKFETLEKLCNHLDCTPNDLLKVSDRGLLLHRLKGTIEKDGYVEIPFSITQQSSNPNDKAYFITAGYWEDQAKNFGTRILNITAGLPMFSDFDTMFKSNDFYPLSKTKSLLNGLSTDRQWSLSNRIAYQVLEKFTDIPNFVTVSLIYGYDSFDGDTYHFFVSHNPNGKISIYNPYNDQSFQ
ncbi:helix-turn-helix domain-containing protein [Limosilactobacillus galli]|uniref:helix-turn-helix domain-containing protein n=1 Tax=Limosilactobacillus galli TaxID=2991834 RepID=UPI0024BABE7B|nr:helix-turn-helix domain-containing protein [Limosilactobacillus galli]